MPGAPCWHQRCPDFPTTQHWPRSRARLSLKESRRKLLDATNLARKSGIRGPNKMGEAHHSFSSIEDRRVVGENFASLPRQVKFKRENAPTAWEAATPDSYGA